MAPRQWRVDVCVLVVLVACTLLDGVDAKRDALKTKHGRDAKLGRHRMGLYMKLIKYVFAALLLPILGSFVYSLVSDPAVPQIMRRLLETAHQKFSTRLSREVKAKRR